MNGRRWRFVLGGLVAIIVAVMAWLGTRERAPEKLVLAPELAGLMTILPADLPEGQRDEIEGILQRFQGRSEAGEVQPRLEETIITEIRRYVAAGTIEKSELAHLMALVSTATLDVNPEHPLLNPTSQDSTP